MNCTKKIAGFAAALLLTVGCGGPKIIPDRELAQIFHDIYLVNGYVGQRGINIDSLNIYEPVFASYGYTSEDIQYTIGNFAKRKSARLSEDVVEVAVEMLRRESRAYRRRIEIRDTIALVAKKKYAEEVLFREQIRARRIADTSRLRITLSDIKPGSYEVSFSYLIDSLDRNLSLRANAWLVDSTGHESGSSPRRLERERRGTVQTTLASTEAHRRLIISLADYPDDLSVPNLTIDSLRVTYFLPDEIATKRLARSWYGYGTLDSLLALPSFAPLSGNHEAPLLAPGVDPAGARSR